MTDSAVLSHKKIVAKKRAFLAFKYFMLVILGVFIVFPFVYLFTSSLMTDEQILNTTSIIPKVISFESYKTLFEHSELLVYVKNTLIVCVLNISGVCIMSSLTAFGLCKVKFKGQDFVFTLILASVSLFLMFFTKDLQELIISLAYLYDIDVIKMQAIIRTCINERGTINREELRKICRNHYQFDHSGSLPTIIEQTQPEHLRKPIGDNSKMAKMIYTFETTSPHDFLLDKYNGASLSKADTNLLEHLLLDMDLKAGVVNVLIDYVLRINDNK